MHVCTIAPGFNGHGGVSYVARNLVAELARRGVECSVVTDETRDTDVSPSLPADVDVHTVPAPSLPFPLDVLGFSWRARSVLQTLSDVDIYHVHGHFTMVPTIASLFGEVDAPLLVTAHGTYLNEFEAFDSYPSFDSQWRYRLGVRIDHEILKSGLRRADRVHAVSEATGREVERMGVDGESIDVVPNGVNLEEFDADDSHVDVRTEYGLADTPLAVSVGSTVPRKGVHTLVDVADRLRSQGDPAHVVHVGGVGHEGYAETVSEAIEERNLEEWITLTGRVDREELLSWIDTADTFVSASFSEGCPISLLEAAASGTTIVSTDVGGARDVLGDLGIYVEPGNPADIAHGIGRGFTADRGDAIRTRIESDFSWSRIVDDVESVYRRCS